MITKEAILKNLAGSKVYSSITAALKDVQANLTKQHFETVKKTRAESTKAKKGLSKLGQATTSALNKKKM